MSSFLDSVELLERSLPSFYSPVLFCYFFYTYALLRYHSAITGSTLIALLNLSRSFLHIRAVVHIMYLIPQQR